MSETQQYGLSDVPASAHIPAPDLPYLPRPPKAYRPRIGVIGCGGISEYHLDAYQRLGLHVAALCDVDLEKAAARRDQFYPDAAAFASHRELLANAEVDVIDAATHPEPRMAIISDALEAGKHVLSQKPFALNLDDAERLVALAERCERKLAVNQNGRWAPHFAYMREAVARGMIGDIGGLVFSLQWDHSWTKSTTFNEIRHLILFDFGVHWFDMQQVFFAGRDPLRVRAEVARWPGQTMKPAALAHAITEYENGQATVSFNGHVTFGQQDETVLCGTLGTLRSVGPNLTEQTVTLYTGAGIARPELRGTWFTNGFEGAMCELLCAIEENREPVNSGRDNLKTLALCFAAAASADNGGEAVTPGEVREIG